MNMCDNIGHLYTVLIRSLDPFHIVTYYIKMGKDFLDNQHNVPERGEIFVCVEGDEQSVQLGLQLSSLLSIRVADTGIPVGS